MLYSIVSAIGLGGAKAFIAASNYSIASSPQPHPVIGALQMCQHTCHLLTLDRHISIQSYQYLNVFWLSFTSYLWVSVQTHLHWYNISHTIEMVPEVGGRNLYIAVISLSGHTCKVFYMLNIIRRTASIGLYFGLVSIAWQGCWPTSCVLSTLSFHLLLLPLLYNANLNHIADILWPGELSWKWAELDFCLSLYVVNSNCNIISPPCCLDIQHNLIVEMISLLSSALQW